MTIIKLDTIRFFEYDLKKQEAVVMAKMEDELDIESATYLLMNFLGSMGKNARLKNYKMYGFNDMIGFIIKFEITASQQTNQNTESLKN